MDSRLFISSIRSQKEVAPDYFLLSIELPGEVKKPKPGEFFMVRINRNTDPLLRRPLSLYRLLSKDTIQFLYRAKGKGTGLLSKKNAGDKLDLLGPLGRGFVIPSDIDEAILISGGIGIAPLFALAEEMKKKEKPVRLFMGGKSRKDILCEDELRSLDVELFVSTEDGSYGKEGLVTELLEHYLRVQSSELRVKSSKLKTQVYACGPKPMLKRVSEIARAYSLPCYVSLEERMACGVGACLGCAVKVRRKGSGVRGQGKQFTVHGSQFTEYKMVCKDGPVFNSEEIDWDG